LKKSRPIFQKAKSSPKCFHLLGYFIFSKNHIEPPKVAQLAKIAQSGHPAPQQAFIALSNVCK
jgi:hypothetical protein